MREGGSELVSERTNGRVRERKPHTGGSLGSQHWETLPRSFYEQRESGGEEKGLWSRLQTRSR